jgi:hypothetical protein
LCACAVRIVYYKNSWLIGVCKESGGNCAENIPVYSKFPKIINDNINKVYQVYLISSYYKVLLDYLRTIFGINTRNNENPDIGNENFQTELRVAKPKLKLLRTQLLWSTFAYYRLIKKWLTRPPRVDIYNFCYITQRAWDRKKILKKRELLQIICKIYRNFVVCGSLKRIPPKSLTVINAGLQPKF